MTTAKDRLDVESEAVIVQLQKEAEHMIHSMPSSVHFDELWQLHTGGVKQAPRGRHQLSSYKKWIISVTAALTVTAGSIIGIGFISPTVAEALRVIPFFDYLYAKGADRDELKPIEEKQLSNPAGALVTDKGITFNLVEEYYDGISLVLNYEVTYPSSSERITGKEAAVFYKLNFEGHHPQRISSHDFTITGDHTFVGTTRLSFGDKDLPDQLRLNMSIDCIGTTRGNWDVSVLLDRGKSAAISTTVYPKDLDFMYDNSLYTVDKLTLGPVTSQVIVMKRYPHPILYAMLEDDIGTLYMNQGGDGATEEYYYFNFSPLTEINPKPEYMTLVIAETERNNQVKSYEDRQRLSGSLPLTLKGNEGGNVTITAVEYEEKQTVVYYEASQVMSQLTSITLQEGHDQPISQIGTRVRMSKDKLAFKLIFPPVQPSDKLEIITGYFSFPEDMQQFRLRIPVQWTP
ncbi:DUF4179 domain-containing protein [Paenibacillus sp. FSL R7-0337]|uniref:DUF4179 domain-containing protein n=1 Tax=Paenibacillus sp. FSL R7-0337 TaxID=1926588 RepID=UPI00096DA33C|nr:DUF4179 domain-containing protein [Paenibacillus sp. FSL R7-0337]OMF93573.1 hypothetical protein BK147_17780 [Paenibacillus sp. FSL R7-0337]